MFVLQFVYFQFQNSLSEAVAPLVSGIRFPGLDQPENLLNLLHVAVHAVFSIFVIELLYQKKHNTWFVVKMSVGLAALYIACNLASKLLAAPVLDTISTKILFFIASPFKTIFSIPALLLTHDESSPSDPPPKEGQERAQRPAESVE